MTFRHVWLLLIALLFVPQTLAQAEAPSVAFRRGNEDASRRRFDDAMLEYARLAKQGVRAPSLYWNWAQVASAKGRKGEALWALLCAQDLTPVDFSISRELERLRGELGLDPSEVSLGLLGDASVIARRFRFDALAIIALVLSMVATLGRNPRPSWSRAGLLGGLLLVSPLLASTLREPRGVVVQKDAPLMDTPQTDAVALANLREGEVVPLLGEEGDYVRIQDASGARGFAHKNDVRRIGME